MENFLKSVDAQVAKRVEVERLTKGQQDRKEMWEDLQQLEKYMEERIRSILAKCSCDPSGRDLFKEMRTIVSEMKWRAKEDQIKIPENVEQLKILRAQLIETRNKVARICGLTITFYPVEKNWEKEVKEEYVAWIRERFGYQSDYKGRAAWIHMETTILETTILETTYWKGKFKIDFPDVF